MQHPGWWLVIMVGLLANFAPDRARAETVTESDLLARLDADPAFRTALDAPAAVARVRAASAGLLEPPSVAASREDTGDAGLEWTWTARWSPPHPARRRRARAHADAGVALAESGRRVARLAQRSALRAAYADWTVTTEHGRLAEAFRAEIDALAKTEAARAAAGEVPGLSARRLALVARRAGLVAASLATEARQARGRVEALVGPLPVASTPGRPALPPVPARADFPSSGGVGQTEDSPHPRLQAAAAEVARDRLAVDLDRARIAMPEIELGWKQVRTDGLSADGPVLGASWRVPLTGRRKARVAAAEATAAGSEARRIRQATEVTALRSAAWDVYTRRHTLASALPGPDDRLRHAAVEVYRLGEGSLTDLLDTLEALHAAASDAVDLFADTLAAHRALEWAIGHPLALVPPSSAPPSSAPPNSVPPDSAPPSHASPDAASLEMRP